MTATDTAIRLAQIAGHAAADKIGTDIVLIDVSERLAITDVFVIATGNNERQVEAIVDEVEERLRRAGVKPLRREGKRDGRWVLLDYSEIVVHVQHAEERVFYSLERLWKDCPLIEFDPLGPAPELPPSVVPVEVDELDDGSDFGFADADADADADGSGLDDDESDDLLAGDGLTDDGLTDDEPADAVTDDAASDDALIGDELTHETAPAEVRPSDGI